MRSAQAFVLSLIVLAAGCAKGTSEYTHSKERDKLFPAAESYVDRFVDSRFGTPTRIRVWDRLPLRPHKGLGTVASGTQTEVHLTFPETLFPVQAGDGIVFPGSKPVVGEIAKYEASGRVATLAAALEAAPATDAPVLIGPGAVLAEGRRHYAEHCLHCHGVTGDGAGPTARYLNPKPRDYRRGLFKFTSTHYDYKPRREDLTRIILDGIPGTYMPSFKLLRPEETAAIVEYVMFLTMRGQVEDGLSRYLSGDYSDEALADALKDGKTPSDVVKTLTEEVEDEAFAEDTIDPIVGGIAANWEMSQSDDPTCRVFVKSEGIPPTKESIDKGRALFLSDNAGCAKCHGQAGRGDGPSTTSLNSEGSVGLIDSWGHPILPRNLRAGIYRGGRRPYDIYCRITVGIKGTPMPGIREDKMSEEERWHLVNYVLNMPFEELDPGTGVGAPAAQPKVADAAR